MESIEMQTRPRNLSRSNNKYKNDDYNNNPSPIIKSFDPFIGSSSSKSHKKDFNDGPNFMNRDRKSNTSKFTSSKKNSKLGDNYSLNNNKTSDFNSLNNFQNRNNNFNSYTSNNNNFNNFPNYGNNSNSNSQKEFLGFGSSRSTDKLLLNEKTHLTAGGNSYQEQESIINLSCEALYYYLKEKGLISNSRILLLTVIVYLLIMVTHSMHYSFLLFNRPIYFSYKYECMTPKAKTITPCTSRNVCFCEDYGRCVTMTWASDVILDQNLNTTYYFGQKTYESKLTNELKFKFGEVSHYYMYDYKGKVSNNRVNNSIINGIFDVLDSDIISVNFNYKKKDKFCLMLAQCFITLAFYNLGSVLSELVFGYLSDYVGKYVIINILAVIFAMNQVIYFFLFHFIKELNSNNMSYIVWYVFSFFLGISTTPLQSFITCFYLELFPNKDELFSANGLVQSATCFSFILNFLFMIKIRQLKYLFVFFFVITVAFIIIFKKYYTENPRFYSETRYISDEVLNTELKKLAIMQIMDTNKIQSPGLETANNTEKLSESKKTFSKNNEGLTSKNTKDDLIFKKEDIEKKIRAIKREKSKNTKKMNLKRGTLQDLSGAKKRKCPCPFLNFNFKVNQEIKDIPNELVKRNTILNRKGPQLSSQNGASNRRQRVKYENIKSMQSNNSKILRRHGRISKDISGQDMEALTKDLISYNYENDLYIKKFIFTYALVKLSFAICYTSQNFFVHSRITDPNADGEYRSFWFLFNLFFFTKLSYILAGKFSFFMNSRTLNIICLIVFGFIMLSVDIRLIFTSTHKNYYFGDEITYFKYTSRTWIRIFSMITISVVNSLFEISIISYPPTLYRGKVMMKINLLANLAPFMSYIAVFLIDTWAIYIGILALIILFLYFTRLSDFNLEILESRDEAYVTQIKTYINKRFSKINIVDKYEKNKQ